MSRDKNPEHPGGYVRVHVLPEGMSVTKAAETLGVGRPALSNFLNGKAALSPDMAVRLQRAFAADPDDLNMRQAEYDAFRRARDHAISATTRTFVPPLLLAKAKEIEQWADNNSSRDSFAVLLRMLVNSTCGGLKFVDFPGNDDAQRPGWDGRVETGDANPWVPLGVSGWEFGTNQKVTAKANEDYAKRTESTLESDRQITTFVFVTPRRWHGKEKWLKDKREEGHWKEVLAWDSSDIEQWLEQSIAAQAWFGNQRGLSRRGVKSLDRCWVEWCADCNPSFTEHIFDEAISMSKGAVVKHLRDATDVLRIVADSRKEGLAFLYALLSEQEDDLRRPRDSVVVFTEPGSLSELAVGSPGFLPVITHPEVEKELAQSGCKIGAIVIERRTAVQHDADVTLSPPSHPAFHAALATMGLDRENIERLEHESGRSLTVLRRHLAQSASIRSPDWSSDKDLAQALLPLMLAGAWKSDNEADLFLMSALAGCDEREKLEGRFLQLKDLEDSPVWSTGAYRGVVSKLDALYATARWMTTEQISRFMTVAEIVLSERDPSLDIPDDQHGAAAVYDKSREISPPLREGIAESLVLLAIHGTKLFGGRISSDPKSLVSELVCNDLLDLESEPVKKAEKLQSQASNFPLYAEAAPSEFLSILRRDLSRSEPGLAALMTPIADGLFAREDRVYLLWALELLAWHPEWLERTVAVLALLVELEPPDNRANKPSASLRAIFRCWSPQTAAPLEHRVAVFNRLTEQHPEVAWGIATCQFSPDPTVVIGNSHKPKWRDYALGFGEPVKKDEARRFTCHCIQTCLNWSNFDKEKIKNLMDGADVLDQLADCPELTGTNPLSRLGDAVALWARTACDQERACLREHIRTSRRRVAVGASSRSAPMYPLASDECIDMAREAFGVLEPRDVVWKHAWLFQDDRVSDSRDETEDNVDFDHQERIVTTQRRQAMQEVISDAGYAGYAGVLALAFTGNAPDVTGAWAALAFECQTDRAAFAQAVLDDGDILTSASHQRLLRGFFQAAGREHVVQLLEVIRPVHDQEVGIKLLCLSGFDRQVWAKVEEQGESASQNYWADVVPSWRQHGDEDINYAVANLLDAGRPGASLNFAHLDLEHVKSELVHRILAELPTSNEAVGYRLRIRPYTIQKAFNVLNERRALSCSQMADLEFLYLDLLRGGDGSLPNIEKEFEANPSLFCEAIGLYHKVASPADDCVFTEGERTLAQQAYKLLGMLSRIPGQDENGILNPDKLREWVQQAQEYCGAKGYRSQGDHHIGRLLSQAPVGEDGAWPCEPVREALEDVLNEGIETGIKVGRRNWSGAYWMPEGGAQDREFASQYEEWSKMCSYSHPRVSAVLKGLAEDHKNEAHWQDQESAVQRRLGY